MRAAFFGPMPGSLVSCPVLAVLILREPESAVLVAFAPLVLFALLLLEADDLFFAGASANRIAGTGVVLSDGSPLVSVTLVRPCGASAKAMVTAAMRAVNAATERTRRTPLLLLIVMLFPLKIDLMWLKVGY
jgi:hypothetical protein